MNAFKNSDFELKNGPGYCLQGFIAGARFEHTTFRSSGNAGTCYLKETGASIDNPVHRISQNAPQPTSLTRLLSTCHKILTVLASEYFLWDTFRICLTFQKHTPLTALQTLHGYIDMRVT
jgi:hypothetical protein